MASTGFFDVPRQSSKGVRSGRSQTELADREGVASLGASTEGEMLFRLAPFLGRGWGSGTGAGWLCQSRDGSPLMLKMYGLRVPLVR
jgi:hypothetical protein